MVSESQIEKSIRSSDQCSHMDNPKFSNVDMCRSWNGRKLGNGL